MSLDKVWLLWERSMDPLFRKPTLLGVYDNEEAAYSDAAVDARWFVQEHEVDHDPAIPEPLWYDKYERTNESEESKHANPEPHDSEETGGLERGYWERDSFTAALDGIRTQAGITGEIVGRTLYVTPKEFAALRRWADRCDDSGANLYGSVEVVVRPDPESHEEADRG